MLIFSCDVIFSHEYFFFPHDHIIHMWCLYLMLMCNLTGYNMPKYTFTRFSVNHMWNVCVFFHRGILYMCLGTEEGEGERFLFFLFLFLLWMNDVLSAFHFVTCITWHLLKYKLADLRWTKATINTILSIFLAQFIDITSAKWQDNNIIANSIRIQLKMDHSSFKCAWISIKHAHIRCQLIIHIRHINI